MTKTIMIDNGRPGMQVARLAVSRRTPPTRAMIPLVWLHEAALAPKDGDTYPRLNTERVARDCEAMARKMGRV